MRKFAHTGKRNTLRDRDQILHVGRYQGRNHICNFWWWSVKGFGHGRGRISHFHIDLRRCPYNTLALSCECVNSNRRTIFSIEPCHLQWSWVTLKDHFSTWKLSRAIISKTCLHVLLTKTLKMKKHSERRKRLTLHAGCSKAETKNFTPPQNPFLRVRMAKI